MHMMYMTVSFFQFNISLFKVIIIVFLSQFHGGYEATILWDSWSTKTVTSFVFSCIGIFLISIAYEGLKFLRERIHIKQMEKIYAENRTKRTERGTETYGSVDPLTTQEEPSVKDRILNKVHIIQALLHIIQMTISYGLMLVAMTYNYWLFLSLVVGFGFGYLFFGWIRSNVIDRNEHCC